MSIFVVFLIFYGLVSACLMVYEIRRAPVWDSLNVRSR